jgi:hypothetical protein
VDDFPKAKSSEQRAQESRSSTYRELVEIAQRRGRADVVAFLKTYAHRIESDPRVVDFAIKLVFAMQLAPDTVERELGEIEAMLTGGAINGTSGARSGTNESERSLSPGSDSGGGGESERDGSAQPVQPSAESPRRRRGRPPKNRPVGE